MEQRNGFLILAGWLSFLAAALHVAVIFGGADWYRFFGAGEELAQLSEQGSLYPVIVTLAITAILAGWGLYAWSGAGLLFRLPLLRICLVLITAVYCIRGTYGFFVPVLSEHSYVTELGAGFWIWSSLICLTFGVIHMIGVRQSWDYLGNKG
ncbi:hypothetical protein [Hahella ganghwensis]|uniref:hypothetical protein n=1 Tax=Hahella ganghwensis TaxID=286420 RepID=UPI000363794E|nr:hypothetical protein [Hahella ganghwensis]